MKTTAGSAFAAAAYAADAPTPPKLRACVIGDSQHGGYGHSLHLAWAARDDVEVVALADPDAAGREKYAAESHAQRTYADYREMLEKEKPDLITIAPRWTVRHREYLLAAAACRAHGFIEKPVAVDVAEADDMVHAADEKNLKWAIAFNFRATAIIQHARRLIIEQGVIGDVLELRGRGKEDDRAGGEDLLVLGTHVFDLMRFFLGSPQWCSADITAGGRPATRAGIHDATEPIGPILGDRIQAAYGFPNGIIGHFASTRNQHGNGGRWGLDVYGSRGIVTIRQDGQGVPQVYLLREPTWAPGGKTVQWEPLPDAPAVEYKRPEVERNAPIIDDLIVAIRENRRPAISLEDGRDSLEMVQAVHAAYLQSGRVEIPLKDRRHPLAR